jgi:hypothetical protein
LDNRTTAQSLGELLGPRTRSLLLAHISSECNDRDILGDLIGQQLNELDRCDVQWRMLEQHLPDVGCYAM